VPTPIAGPPLRVARSRRSRIRGAALVLVALFVLSGFTPTMTSGDRPIHALVPVAAADRSALRTHPSAPVSTSPQHAPLGGPTLAGPFGSAYLNVSESFPFGDARDGVAVAIDAARSIVYTANGIDGRVVAFNESTGTPIASALVGDFFGGETLAGLALDPDDGVIAVGVDSPGPSSPRLVFLNASTLVAVRTTTFAGAPAGPFQPGSLAYDPASRQVFVQNSTSGDLAVVTAANGTVRTFIPCGVFPCGAGGIAVVPTYHLLIDTLRSPAFEVIGTITATLNQTVGVAGTSATEGAAYDPFDGWVLIGDASPAPNASLLRFYPGNWSALPSVPAPYSNLTALTYDATQGVVVAADSNESAEVWALDPTTGATLAHVGHPWTIGAPLYTALAVDEVAGTLVTAGSSNDSTVRYQLPALDAGFVYPTLPYSVGGILLDPGAGLAIVRSSGPANITAYRLADGGRVWSWSYAAIGFTSWAIDPLDHRLYLPDSVAGEIRVFDDESGTELAPLPTPGITADALAVDPAHATLLVGDDGGYVDFLATSNGSLLGQTPIDGFLPCLLVYDPGTDAAYVGNCHTGRANVTTVYRGNETQGPTYAVGQDVVDLAMATNSSLYAVAYDDHNVSVIDVVDRSIVGNVTLPAGAANHLAIDPSLGLAFVTGVDAPTISVLDTATNALVGTLAMPGAVNDVAADPDGPALVAPEVVGGALIVGSLVVPPGLVGAPRLAVSNATIVAAWDLPTASGGAPITHYSLLVYPNGSATPAINRSVTTLTATVTGLVDGVPYSVAVVAWNVAGASGESPRSNGTPLGVPYPPTGLRVTANVTALAISWDPPTSNGGAPVVNYTVYSASNGTGIAPTDAGTGNPFLLTGLLSETDYAVFVTAWNSQGEGHPSAIVHATTLPVVPVPPCEGCPTTSPGSPAFTVLGVPWWALAGIAIAVILGLLMVMLLQRRRPGRPSTASLPPQGAVGDVPRRGPPDGSVRR